jgi:hypothetical protein
MRSSAKTKMQIIYFLATPSEWRNPRKYIICILVVCIIGGIGILIIGNCLIGNSVEIEN